MKKYSKKFKYSSLKKFVWGQKSGSTLIELLIYIAVLGIILLVVTDLLSQSLEASVKSQVRNEVEENSRLIFERIKYDVRRAGAITVPANLGETQNSLVLTIDGQPLTFSKIGNALFITNGLISDPITTNEVVVDSISFQKIGGKIESSGGKPTLKISLSLRGLRATKQGTLTKSWTTTLSLR